MTSKQRAFLTRSLAEPDAITDSVWKKWARLLQEDIDRKDAALRTLREGLAVEERYSRMYLQSATSAENLRLLIKLADEALGEERG